MNITKKHFLTVRTQVGALLFAIALMFAFASCVTNVGDIPESVSVGEIVQMGQNAEDRNRYNSAIVYYETIKERFPTDAVAIAGADYAIAHCHYKQRKYVTARTELNDLLERYNSPLGAALPKKYQVLATSVLNLIAQKTKVVADE
jgi:outer membrane protein assembly factor BamD (BamD/ComL family)